MEGNRPQSFLEIGHATQLLLSSARPEMVMVAGRTTGSASPEQGGLQQESAPQQAVTASQEEVDQGISPVTSGNSDESVKTVGKFISCLVCFCFEGGFSRLRVFRFLIPSGIKQGGGLFRTGEAKSGTAGGFHAGR